jgi:hypothetical protein
VGTMRQPIYTPSCSTETMVVPLPTTPWSGTWGESGAATVRRRDGWATRGCLFLREKAAHAIHSSTWHICGELLPPPAQLRGDQSCAGNDGCCGVDKGWLGISLFCSEECRLRCEMEKYERSIGIGNQ